MKRNEIFVLLAKITLTIAAIMTAIGGMSDLSRHDYQFTGSHMWNDGLFLAIVSVFLLLLART